MAHAINPNYNIDYKDLTSLIISFLWKMKIPYCSHDFQKEKLIHDSRISSIFTFQGKLYKINLTDSKVHSMQEIQVYFNIGVVSTTFLA